MKTSARFNDTGRTYGIFQNPIFEDETGTEFVAELRYINDDGTPGGLVCQSRGCDYCDSEDSHLGCRHSAYNANCYTGFFIGDERVG